MRKGYRSSNNSNSNNNNKNQQNLDPHGNSFDPFCNFTPNCGAMIDDIWDSTSMQPKIEASGSRNKKSVLSSFFGFFTLDSTALQIIFAKISFYKLPS
jgi:uncharacterized DUF497 family protein